jgi:monofunctional glycosyltransferase
MKVPARTKGIGARRRGGSNRPAGANPFAAFESVGGSDEAPEEEPEEEPELEVDSEADFEAELETDPDPDEATAPSPAARSASGPRARSRRLLALSLLFFLVMPAMPVLILRFLPPVVSTMMVKRWVDAHVEGRDFDLQYDWVSRDEIARSLRRAVVASEDQRFYEHAGFDWKELQNALDEWRDGGSLRGASTISQQVAKNLFLWPGRSFLRKVFEAWFTLWIEWLWPKERILEVYLNVAEMGDGVFGAEAASRRYFKHSAATLAPHEAALLAAILPSPLRSNPANPSPYLRQRQRWILRQI